MQLSGVLADDVPTVWRDVKPILSRVICLTNGENTLDSVYDALLRKDMQLWVGHEVNDIVYVGISEIVTYLSGRKVAIVTMLAGDRMNEFISHMDAFKEWAASYGCKAIRVIGRKGWVKVLPGFKQIYTVLECEL